MFPYFQEFSRNENCLCFQCCLPTGLGDLFDFLRRNPRCGFHINLNGFDSGRVSRVLTGTEFAPSSSSDWKKDRVHAPPEKNIKDRIVASVRDDISGRKEKKKTFKMQARMRAEKRRLRVSESVKYGDAEGIQRPRRKGGIAYVNPYKWLSDMCQTGSFLTFPIFSWGRVPCSNIIFKKILKE